MSISVLKAQCIMSRVRRVGRRRGVCQLWSGVVAVATGAHSGRLDKLLACVDDLFKIDPVA